MIIWYPEIMYPVREHSMKKLTLCNTIYFYTGLSNGMYTTDEPEKILQQPSVVYQGFAFCGKSSSRAHFTAIIIPVRYFIDPAVFVNGASMESTFEDGDYILIDEISYRFNEPARGRSWYSVIPMIKHNFHQTCARCGRNRRGERQQVIITTQTIRPVCLMKRHISIPNSRRKSVKMKLDPYFVMGDNRLHETRSLRGRSTAHSSPEKYLLGHDS